MTAQSFCIGFLISAVILAAIHFLGSDLLKAIREHDAPEIDAGALEGDLRAYVQQLNEQA